MNKSEKIIYNFFKNDFEKYKDINSIYFVISRYGESIVLSEEDCGFNEKRWSEFGDKILDKKADAVAKARSMLKQENVLDLDLKLEKLEINLRNQSWNSDPRNKIMENIWNEKRINSLTNKVFKHLLQEVPWEIVNYCVCTVCNDGKVDIRLIQRY